MKNENELKALVKEKYAAIAEQSREDNASSCCGAGGCSTEVYNIMTDDYTNLKGYNADADLGLGCGLPTAFAKIKEGDTVIDLGSGAGNDCFVARAATGPLGKGNWYRFYRANDCQSKAECREIEFPQCRISLGRY